VEKTKSFQEIYSKYSRLDFTRLSDRPIAIRGLEARLIGGFPSKKGGHGIFGDSGFFHHGLLWRRGDDEPALRRIEFPDGQDGAPTWSWMAYQGGISYIDPADALKEYTTFDSVVWESADRLRSPWNRVISNEDYDDEDERSPRKKVKHMTSGPTERAEDWDLTAVARDFFPSLEIPRNGKEREKTKKSMIYYDVPGMSTRQGLKCVVVGWERHMKDVKDKTHYVLIVAPAPPGRRKGWLGLLTESGRVYERVGVGLMPGRSIDFEAPGLDVKVY
jgi:hypothetical protein